MPKAVPPQGPPLKFQGCFPWPLINGIDEWGLTSEQQETYIEQFRRIVDAKNAWNEEVDDYFTLRRFMRARTYDLERATAMWLNHMAWKKEFSVPTILQDFVFTERDEFVFAYPQGYHKIDKEGRPIYIQQLGKIDVNKLKKICSEDRMIKFHIQEYERCRKVILPICSRLAGHHIDQTFAIMDVSGVGMSHLTGEVKRLMGLVTKYDQDNYPEMLGHICIINAPAMFRMLWSVVKGFIDPRTQSKIEILGTDYKKGLLNWIDEDNLPKFLGGLSDGSLLDDLGPWSDSVLCNRIGVDVEELMAGKRLQPMLHFGTIQSRRYAAAAAASSANLGAVRVSADGPRRDSGGSISQGLPGGAGLGAPSKRMSGVAEDLVEEVSRRYAASVGSASPLSGGSLTGGSHDGTGFPTIHEGTPTIREGTPPGSTGKHRALVARIADLEKRLPAHMERLKLTHSLADGGAAQSPRASQSPRHSNKSAPEGSLLNRVEVLEEALESLLMAQDAALLFQQQLIDAQQEAVNAAMARGAKTSQGGCGCCVM